MRVLVIGGGPAGCMAAFTLRRLGHEVCLYEAAPQLGGRTAVVDLDGVRVETGAVLLFSFYHRTLGLLRELGQERALQERQLVFGLHDGSSLVAVRYRSPLDGAWIPWLSWREKIGLARMFLHAAVRPRLDLFDLDALVAADRGQTIADWTRARVSAAAFEYVVRPMIEPICLVGCAEAATPLLEGLLQVTPRVRFYHLSGGMDRLCHWLAAGIDVHLAQPIRQLEITPRQVRAQRTNGTTLTADAVVVATDAPTAAGLFPDTPTARALTEIRYASSTLVVLGWRNGAWCEAEVSSVTPVGTGEHMVRMLSRFSHRCPDLLPPGAEAIGVYFDHAASHPVDEEALIQAARRAVARYLPGVAPAPDLAYVVHHPRAATVPVPGQYATLRRLRLPQRLQLAGDYFSTASVEAAVRSGERAAQTLHEALASHPGTTISLVSHSLSRSSHSVPM